MACDMANLSKHNVKSLGDYCVCSHACLFIGIETGFHLPHTLETSPLI